MCTDGDDSDEAGDSDDDGTEAAKRFYEGLTEPEKRWWGTALHVAHHLLGKRFDAEAAKRAYEGLTEPEKKWWHHLVHAGLGLAGHLIGKCLDFYIKRLVLLLLLLLSLLL